YPIDGEIVVDGTRRQRLATGQIGWLEFGGPSTTVRLTAGKNGSRVMLYAGARQNLPIVTHGPFVGETHADLIRVSRAYAEGRMPRVSELAGFRGLPDEPGGKGNPHQMQFHQRLPVRREQ